ncbi:MAG: DMT family transporter [Candidatus Helarchaeota archaeon]
MADVFLGILLAIIAYASLYLGKGIQKFAIEGYTQEGLTRGEKGKNMGIWILGLVLTGAFMFIHLFALKFAAISIVAPIEGLGLLILCFFSYFILKEPINLIKTIGIALIIVGLILISIFMPDPEAIPKDFDATLFLIFLATILGFFLILGLYSKQHNYKAAGAIFGSFAGVFMCFQTITKRITWIEGYSWVVFIMFGFAAATLLVTNFGFLKADAVVVVPFFSAVSIMLPTIIAIFIFGESTVPIQWIGIIIIVFGVIFLTAFSPGTNKDPLTKIN